MDFALALANMHTTLRTIEKSRRCAFNYPQSGGEVEALLR
jgi:hypothetical protein